MAGLNSGSFNDDDGFMYSVEYISSMSLVEPDMNTEPFEQVLQAGSDDIDEDSTFVKQHKTNDILGKGSSSQQGKNNLQQDTSEESIKVDSCIDNCSPELEEHFLNVNSGSISVANESVPIHATILRNQTQENFDYEQTRSTVVNSKPQMSSAQMGPNETSADPHSEASSNLNSEDSTSQASSNEKKSSKKKKPSSSKNKPPPKPGKNKSGSRSTIHINIGHSEVTNISSTVHMPREQN